MNKGLIQRLLDCDITWKEFSNIEKCNSYLIESDNLVISINERIVKNAIQSCIDNKYTIQDLLDWANVVRFSDIFIIEDGCRDCVISVLDRIEESDEEGCELSNNDLLLMIDKLNHNKVW